VTSRKVLPARRAERAGRVLQRGVDAVETDVDVEDHEGQQEMHQPQDHGRLVVEHLDRLVDDPDPHQRGIDRARGPENVDPGHGADDVADPERQHQQQQQNRLVAARTGDE
jgi:hypothetical protein